MTEYIDIEWINVSLKKYPNIKRIFGEIKKVSTIYNYPYKQDKDLDNEFNFFGILNIKEEYNIPFKNEFLEEIDFLIGRLNKIYTDKQLKDGLTNNPFSFKTELDFANFCLDRGYEIIEVEPKLKSGKKLDLKIKINNKPFLVEVISPRLKKDMLERSVGAFSISDELEFNLKSEFDHHEIINNGINEGFIIVCNGDYAGIDSINIQSAIEKFDKTMKNESKYLSGIFLKERDKFTFFPIAPISDDT